MTKDIRKGLIAIVLTATLLPSCFPPTVVLIETNYEIDQSIITSIGNEMVVIEKIRETSPSNDVSFNTLWLRLRDLNQ